MILPRRLMTYTGKDGRLSFCEADDVRQEMNYHGPGFVIPDTEAERIGLKAYLDTTGWGETVNPSGPVEAKAVPQAKTEDKAVAGPGAVGFEEKSVEATESEEPAPGLHIDPESRRGRRA